jgi:hypothetical protein
MLLQDEARLIALALGYIRDECPEQVASVDSALLERLVIDGLAVARQHGFTSPPDLLSFIGMMFDVSPSFHEQTDIAAALADESVALAQRLDAALHIVPDEAWEDAARNGDVSGWIATLEDRGGSS